MIIVTGATGQLGEAVVQNLLDRVSTDQIAASVRDASKASDLAAQGVEIRVGDFADADGLIRAFANADQVLIVSADKLGEEALRLHHNAIQAARRAGVRRVLYTSHMGARTLRKPMRRSSLPSAIGTVFRGPSRPPRRLPWPILPRSLQS